MAQGPEPLNSTVKATGGFGGKALWAGINLYTSFGSYKDYRAEGQSRLSALGNATMDFVLPELMGIGGYLGYELIKHAPGALLNGAQSISQNVRQMERTARDQSPFRANTFVDSQQIYTMRQAGMALAEQSKYALQQSLMGDEARFMHR